MSGNRPAVHQEDVRLPYSTLHADSKVHLIHKATNGRPSVEAEETIEAPDDVDLPYRRDEITRALDALLADDEFWERLYVLAARAIRACKSYHRTDPGIDPGDVVVKVIDKIKAGDRKCPRSMPVALFIARNIRWITRELFRPPQTKARTMRDAETGRPLVLRIVEIEEELVGPGHQSMYLENEVACQWFIERFHDSLASLPNAQKVLRARFVEGLEDDDEVAETTGLTRVQVSSARRTIKRRFTQFKDANLERFWS